MRLDSRTRAVTLAMAVILAIAGLVGTFGAPLLVARTRGPLERARGLAASGQFAEAEQAYLVLARARPDSVPVLIELLDAHAAGDSSDAFEAPIDALLAAPSVPANVALLGRWWREVLRDEPNAADDAAVHAGAAAEPPMPWANHLLGRQSRNDDEEEQAAEWFAREASSFDDRRGDADAACQQWIEQNDWPRLAEALRRPGFAHQVGADIRMEDALRRSDWAGVARWFFPSQYEGATLPILLLAGVSALVWFAICATIGRVRERPGFRVPLYMAAFVLGIGSTYVTMAVALIEQRVLALAEKGQPILDLIYYVVGVGVREELAKALLFLPLVPVLRRWGTRRESFACGALVGLGFAAEENVGYFHMGLATALSRFLTANFLHISATGLVAVAIDDAVRGRETREGDLSRTLMLAVVAHGLYDFFLSGAADGGSFLSMFVFIFLARRFVDVLRELPGREEALASWLLVGLAVVAGASFVYASTLVGPWNAAIALLEGMFGVAIVAYVFVRELWRV